MPCYRPMEAWYSKEVNTSGKRSLVFSPAGALQPDAPIEIACGQCVGCRLERSRQWAIRCMHEAERWEDNCFLTLTFSPEYLEKRDNPWSVDVADFQKFMKRLRKKFTPKNPYEKGTELYKDFANANGIRFFHCGEYGDINLRPHYHAILFNFDFPDKKLFKVSNGHRVYTSDTLSKLWPYGFATIGAVSFDSAAYVARYVMKKITGDDAEQHYKRVIESTGEEVTVNPEYVTMSRKEGIGKYWINQHIDDVYPRDYIVVKGKKCRPPKYYDKVLEDYYPFDHDFIKDERKKSSLTNQLEQTPERLAVKEKIKHIQIKRLIRCV